MAARPFSAAVKKYAGESAPIQRCQVHKRRNVLDHLTDEQKPSVAKKLNGMGGGTNDTKARTILTGTALPATTGIAADWFRRFEGAGLDGVIAKDKSGIYESNKRVMLKVKHERDCDCVVAGFRWYKKGDRTLVGSLLLGLYDDHGTLQHVGVCSSFSMEKRKKMAEFLQPYREDALANHPWKAWAEHGADPDAGMGRMPGGQSRWSGGKA